jgi:pilus assembly protein Flp/PilA
MSRVIAFLKDETGATAIEYGLIAAGISIVIIASVNAIGSSLNTKFSSISTQLKYRRGAVFCLMKAARHGGFFPCRATLRRS